VSTLHCRASQQTGISVVRGLQNYQSHGASALHPITSDENQLGVYACASPFSDMNPNNFQRKAALKNFSELYPCCLRGFIAMVKQAFGGIESL
jgi:hypothetical protein